MSKDNITHVDFRQLDQVKNDFYEWMDSKQIMKLHTLVYIQSVEGFDCGPTYKVIDTIYLGGFEINWDALAVDVFSETYSISLTYFTEDRNEYQSLLKRVCEDRILYVKGDLCVLNEDDGTTCIKLYPTEFHNLPHDYKKHAKELFQDSLHGSMD